MARGNCLCKTLQEDILRIDAAAPKRKASPVSDTRQPRPRAARANIPALYREEQTGINITAEPSMHHDPTNPSLYGVGLA
jgi:hypothetical protein